jgi:LTXXQ motif family protein
MALDDLTEINFAEPEISMNVVRRHAMPATVLATLLLAALPLASMAQQERAPADPPQSARMHEHMQQGMEKHLDHLAARLEIRASQQEAWKGFAGAVRGLVPATPPEPAAKDLDAAARARQAADRAADRAKRLAQLADATAKLQQTLDPPQKEVLNEVAREFGHQFHGHGDGPWSIHHHMLRDHCDGPMHDEHWHQHEKMRDGMHDG